ncbi:methyltransferase domain-containing protein [Haloarchaeobius sp. HME9146]|uniref:methyltransferase domain-containing protein n=1 Tax=Haloarchaeobius sp. HME9146 TaxID=2978732 RepID=UPI0021C20FA9|nr:class I SAM-dependent methyltransferase [Haloarchaeobius sp. HME9146]MCT9095321.1 class I SAM-dependent methyltransferase [Haloarchaeobius sp. HME9146]
MSEQTETTTETLFLLWAARETGVLDALVADADTPAEIAAQTGITERAARLTVETLADEGFFAQVDGAYEPTNRALGFLAASDLRSVSRLPHELDVLAALRELPETMRTGEPDAAITSAADATWNELGHVQATDAATVRACVTAAQHAMSGTDTIGRVLDLGGAPGTYAVEFATRGYDVTLLDSEERLAESESLLAHEPVETVAGEPAALDSEDAGSTLPAVDCVFVPMRTHEFDTATNRELVERAHEVLTTSESGESGDTGGWLVVVDHLRDRSSRATATAVTELATGEGACYTSDRYRAWFDGAGFRAVQVRDVPGTARQVVFGQARV